MTERARVYAQALYELACEDGCPETYLEEVRQVAGLLEENPEYLRLVSDPALSKPERTASLDHCFGGQVKPWLLNFMKVLVDADVMREFPGCAEAFTQRYQAEHGILAVTAITAVPLEAAQREALVQKLARTTGKEIELTERLDPSLLGGVRLLYEGKMVDGTVAARLRGVEQALHRLRIE